MASSGGGESEGTSSGDVFSKLMERLVGGVKCGRSLFFIVNTAVISGREADERYSRSHIFIALRAEAPETQRDDRSPREWDKELE